METVGTLGEPVAVAWVGPRAVEEAKEIYRTRFNDVPDPVREERETT